MRLIQSVLLCAHFAGIVLAQTPLKFDVASIHPHAPGDNRSSTRLVDGGVDATNLSLRQLILRAFNIQDFQLAGGAAWVSDDRWDLQARTPDFVMPPDMSKLTEAQNQSITDQMQERLRNLLADRFQLVTHRETREQPVYALLVAKNGPKLAATKVEGNNRSVNTNGNNGVSRATFKGVPMSVLAQQLSRTTERAVIDQTGLTGRYDFTLNWAVDLSKPDTADAPSIFTALQEQLGLRLDSQKGPVEVIVIDSASRPSEN